MLSYIIQYLNVMFEYNDETTNFYFDMFHIKTLYLVKLLINFEKEHCDMS